MPHTQEERMLKNLDRQVLLSFSTLSISTRSHPFSPSHFYMTVHALIMPLNEVSIKTHKDAVLRASGQLNMWKLTGR